MKLFSYTTRASIPALCLALLTLFVWQQPSGWFQATSNSPSASPSAGAPASGGTQRLASAEQVPDGLQHSDWNSIRSAYEKQRHAVVAVEGGQRAHNPGQQWRTRFDGRGFAVTPDQGDWTWGLELDSYGFAAAPRAVGGQARVTTEGQRVAYQWDETLEEWYVNDRRGLEHGFTLKARPTPADASGNGPLELRLRVRGKLRAQVTADGQSVSFVQPDGGAVVNYSGLKVWDADGKAVAARFAPVDGAGDRLRLTVEESGAQYPLTIDPIAQQAYLKASNTEANDNFGYSVAVSGDTVVVGAPTEDSNATGVNGDGTNNLAAQSGAAYVFVRSGTAWTQQAYLKTSNIVVNALFGSSVALVGDTLVVGAPGNSGAAYVFVRSGTTWTQQAYLQASNAEVGALDLFGWSVALAGDTLVVGARWESSNATGVNGDGTNNLAPAAGAAYVFVRSGTTWSQQAYLKASNPEASDWFGSSVAVSGDTVVVGAPLEDSNATGVNGDGTNNSTDNAGAAYVFVRSGTTWTQQAYLKASNTLPATFSTRDEFGFSVAVSGDTVVVGAWAEDGNATGEVNGLANGSGAAYVFVRSGATWTQQAYLKASNTEVADGFGISVALVGDTLVVGATGESSNATGVNGDETNNLAFNSGAVYVFVRSGTTWSQQAYLKASNTGASDIFGLSVALAGDTLVVGAPSEDSNATGVNGDGTNNLATDSGAAYVFNGVGVTSLPPRVVKSFPGGSTVVVGQTGVVGFEIFNDNAATNLSGISFTDTFPAGIVVADTSGSISTGGTYTVTGNVLTVSGATVPANSSGTFMLNYTAGPASVTPYTNTIASVSSTQGGTNTTPSTAQLTVNKASTTVAITADTPDPSVIGQNYAVTAAVSVTSPGSGTPGGTITVSDGTNNCTITLPATSCNLPSASVGAKTLTATYNGDANYNGSGPSAGVSHTVSKAEVTVAITSDNPDSSQVGQNVTVAFTVAAAAPGAGTPTGNVTVSDGVNSCTATVAAGQCTLALTTPGARTLTASYNGDGNFNSGTSAGEPHAVVAPPSIAKAFTPPSTPIGGTSTLTITITNPAANTVALTGLAFTDNFPTGLLVANPLSFNNSCGGTLTDNTGSGLAAGDAGIRLNGGTVGTGAPRTCTITVNVTPTVAGPFVNLTGNVSSTNGGTGNTATATLLTNTPPTISSNNVPVQAGSSAAPFTIATAADADQAVNTLGITINGNPTTASSNGVTVSNVAIQANGSVTANISTTCAATTATFNLVVTDNENATGTGTLTVTVTPNMPPMLSYNAVTVVGGSTPVITPATGPSDNGTFTIGSVSVSPNNGGLVVLLNQINGTVTILSATLTGNYTVTVPIADNCGASHNAQLNITVVCPTVSLNASSLPAATVNTAYPQTISASPAGGNYSFSVTSGLLPAGLTLNSNGSFSGAPTQSGTFNFRVTASGFAGTGGSCTAFADYTLLVNCTTITVNPASLPGGSIGATYNQSVSASPAGTYSYTVSSGALPPGLTLNAASGAITGAPTTGGTFNFTITASQGACSGSQSFSVTIGCAAISLNPASPLPSGQAGVAYSQTISASPAGSYTYSLVSGSLPSGLTLNPTTGLLSGLPTVTGNYSFTIQALAGGGCTASQSYALAIVCPTVTLSPATLPNASTGAAYSQTVAAAPAGGNYTYAVTTGSLPAGLNLNASTGVISGTPTVANSFTFRVTATGFGGCAGFRDYTIVIGGGGCPTITLPASLPNGSVGMLYNSAAAASPAGLYTYSATGSLPPGVTLYSGIGLIFGYPTAAGSYTFTITATAGACSGSRQYTVLIGAGFASSLTVFSDFDGDGKSDLSVFRGTDGSWLVANSGDGQLQSTPWGSSAAPYFDLAVSGDYDGDGKTDQAVFRRGTDLAGYWFIKRSSDGAVMRQQWGLPTDVPVAGDYDGDGQTDIAVWRGSAGAWYILRSSDGGVDGISWGAASAGDVPVPGDYDADGKTDVAVFRRTDGHWYIKRSVDGAKVNVEWGLGTDVPVPGDYDGDGKTDYAVWRASEGNWYIIESGSARLQTVTLGTQDDVPALADYDGDGKADPSVWRASTGTWTVKRSSDGTEMTKTHGQSGDVPVMARGN